MESGAYYVGEWRECDQRDGKGKESWQDGSRDEGYWQNDRANGNGRLTYENGQYYDGEWADDLMSGYGVFK